MRALCGQPGFDRVTRGLDRGSDQNRNSEQLFLLAPRLTGGFHVGTEVGGERELLPRPISLVTVIWPFISDTNRETIARPRPVPPKRRVVEETAWAKGKKIELNLSVEIPCPLSVR